MINKRTLKNYQQTIVLELKMIISKLVQSKQIYQTQLKITLNYNLLTGFLMIYSMKALTQHCLIKKKIQRIESTLKKESHIWLINNQRIITHRILIGQESSLLSLRENLDCLTQRYINGTGIERRETMQKSTTTEKELSNSIECEKSKENIHYPLH